MRLIDADALIERLNYCLYSDELVRVSSITGTFLTEYCSPTIEAEPVKRGWWRGWHGDKMVGPDKYRHYHYYSCSVCYKGSAVASNYCPNCGAKMDLKEASHDR